MPDSMSADQLLSRLDSKLSRVISEIEHSEVYQTFTDAHTSPALLVAILKNILLETYSYGSYLTAATAAAIAGLGAESWATEGTAPASAIRAAAVISLRIVSLPKPPPQTGLL